MRSNVRYLNSWLDCGDDVLRENYKLQDRINEKKALFWYDVERLRINDYQAWLCYDRFIHANRDRLKLVKESQDDT